MKTSKKSFEVFLFCKMFKNCDFNFNASLECIIFVSVNKKNKKFI
jgi:hypothetical protein